MSRSPTSAYPPVSKAPWPVAPRAFYSRPAPSPLIAPAGQVPATVIFSSQFFFFFFRIKILQGVDDRVSTWIPNRHLARKTAVSHTCTRFYFDRYLRRLFTILEKLNPLISLTKEGAIRWPQKSSFRCPQETAFQKRRVIWKVTERMTKPNPQIPNFEWNEDWKNPSLC